jgi:hypothetical protein
MPGEEHGTKLGYWRHHRAGTEPCDPCRQAWAANQRDYRARARQAVVEEAYQAGVEAGRSMERAERARHEPQVVAGHPAQREGGP